MLYRVYRIQTITTAYEVEATDENEAEALVNSGKAEEVDYDNDTKLETEPA